MCDEGERDRVLLLMPRSSLGFKYGIRLSNTVGVIDADYADSDNEGHIIISMEIRLPRIFNWKKANLLHRG